MAKRLSSLFSPSKDDGRPDLSQSGASRESSSPTLVQSISNNKSHKDKLTSRSEAFQSLDSGVGALAPPPLLSDSGGIRPPSIHGSGSRPGSRASSPRSGGGRSRPQTPNLLIPPGGVGSGSRPTTPNSAKANKRRSWLPGKSDKPKVEDAAGSSRAWIAGLREHVPYDIAPLLKGDRVDDLWNDKADTLIYLFPKSSGRGPSFKIDSMLFSDSSALLDLRFQAQNLLAIMDPQSMSGNFSNLSMQAPRGSPGNNVQQQPNRMSMNFSVPGFSATGRDEKHVYLPLDLGGQLSIPGLEPHGDDLELIVLYRNFFSFLGGGALVATPRQFALPSIFMGISSILKRFNFSNADGSTWGVVPSNSFARYCDELRLADVRTSREKTIEAIVLGEYMRSWSLYNEGFVHAAGRLSDIKSINSSKFAKITPITVNRLERASLDIEQRLLIVRAKLSDFDFPSMFSGIANSQTSTEAKLVRFKSWKTAFIDVRRFTMSFYRRKYGAWPPKASSKKNNFEESGLNRLLLKELYKDFTDLYDILVDRTTLTPRTTEMPALSDDAQANDLNESIQHALRRVESEYDRATPPVMPAIPFDVPIIPGFANSFNRGHVMTDRTAMSVKRLKENEVNEVLLGSYNRDSIKASTFVQDFFAYERRMGNGKTIDEIVDLRCGQWLFIYAVLQSLPMTVVDARDIKYRRGVEYFLCIPPRGGRSWMKEDVSKSRAWYNVASGGGVVSLPADIVDHSVEGIYRRSHCWVVATKWAQDNGLISPNDGLTAGAESPLPLLPVHDGNSPYLSPVGSPFHSPQASPMLRPISPGVSDGRLSRGTNRSCVNLGLDATATPPERAPRPVSVLNPNITFDAILGGPEKTGKKGKK